MPVYVLLGRLRGYASLPSEARTACEVLAYLYGFSRPRKADLTYSPLD